MECYISIGSTDIVVTNFAIPLRLSITKSILRLNKLLRRTKHKGNIFCVKDLDFNMKLFTFTSE